MAGDEARRGKLPLRDAHDLRGHPKRRRPPEHPDARGPVRSPRPGRPIRRTDDVDLRRLKVGYRAKTFRRISEAFGRRSLDERLLREMPRERIEREVGDLYGVGPATLEYLLFEDFYFLDGLRLIPPWERKIMSRFLFPNSLVRESRILRFFHTRYPGYEKLAFHYLWEDLFWRRDRETID